MATIMQARQEIADVVSQLDGFTVKPYEGLNNIRLGDGWVLVTGGSPSTFTESMVTFQVVLILGPDRRVADKKLDEIIVPVIDLVTYELTSANVSVQTEYIGVGDTDVTNVFCLVVNLELEVTKE